MARPKRLPARFEVALRPDQVATLRLHAAALGVFAPDLVRRLIDRPITDRPKRTRKETARGPR